jgi:DNA-binding response OmpR family regulator
LSAAARIVVLDGEPIVRSVIAKILKHGGYTVEEAGTVEAAVEIVKSAPPDLLLTNVSLPGISGRDAMRLIRSLRPDLPVLMVSGLPEEDIIHEWAGRDDGFDTFPKPFTAQELLNKVRLMQARKRQD